MTCEEAQELITALVDRELLDPERGSLESHLQQCPSCRLAVEEEQLLKQTIRGRAERMRAPSELRDRILSDRRIFPDKSRTRWQDRLWPMPHLARPALAAAVLLAIALPAFFFFRVSKNPSRLLPLKVMISSEKVRFQCVERKTPMRSSNS